MTFRRLGLAALLVIIVAVAGIAYYFIQLTAPVAVSQSVPVAPTLAAPAAPAAASDAQADTAGNTLQDPAANGAPPAGMPGFPPGGGGFHAAPESNAPPAAPTMAPASSGSAQVYRIDASQSSASYNVAETFLQAFAGMQPGNVTTVGTSKAVAGDILLDTGNPAASQLGEIVVDISQLQSDIGMRDNAIRRQWLESANYPLATFKNATLSGLPASWTQGQPLNFKISGDLTVHGTTKPVTWDATATLDGQTLKTQATTNIKMSDFGVQAPSMPMLNVKDDATLKLDLVAQAVK